MKNNSLQLSKLIERLWTKTQAGELHWEQLSDRSSYQTRQGDFVISLSGQTGGLGGGSTYLTIKRLDGRVVTQISSGPFSNIATASAFGAEQDRLSPQSEIHLKQLLTFLSSRSPDLDELLRLMK